MRSPTFGNGLTGLSLLNRVGLVQDLGAYPGQVARPHRVAVLGLGDFPGDGSDGGIWGDIGGGSGADLPDLGPPGDGGLDNSIPGFDIGGDASLPGFDIGGGMEPILGIPGGGSSDNGFDGTFAGDFPGLPQEPWIMSGVGSIDTALDGSHTSSPLEVTPTDGGGFGDEFLGLGTGLLGIGLQIGSDWLKNQASGIGTTSGTTGTKTGGTTTGAGTGVKTTGTATAGSGGIGILAIAAIALLAMGKR